MFWQVMFWRVMTKQVMTERVMTERSPSALLSGSSPFNARIRWLVLGLALTPILGAFLYNLGLRITPADCFFQQTFGFPGPACGMTRSLMALARGDWQQALTYHLFGPLLFGICVAAILQAGAELLMGRSMTRPAGQFKAGRMVLPVLGLVGLVTGVLLFLAYYALRLYLRYDSGRLPFDFVDTAIWQQLVVGARSL